MRACVRACVRSFVSSSVFAHACLIHVCMCVILYVCTYLGTYVRTHVRTYVPMYAYACMFVRIRSLLWALIAMIAAYLNVCIVLCLNNQKVSVNSSSDVIFTVPLRKARRDFLLNTATVTLPPPKSFVVLVTLPS